MDRVQAAFSNIFLGSFLPYIFFKYLNKGFKEIQKYFKIVTSWLDLFKTNPKKACSK